MSWLRKSGWQYSTGAGGGASLEFLMASGGDIILTAPDEQTQSFYYGGVGVGFRRAEDVGAPHPDFVPRLEDEDVTSR